MFFTTLSAIDDQNFLHREDTVERPKVLLHNILEGAFAHYDDNGKESAQTVNHKLCHRFTLPINKQYFTSLKKADVLLELCNQN